MPVKVCSSTGELVTTYAFLDGGSNSSFCSQSLKDQLNVESKKHRLYLTTLDNDNKPVDCDTVTVQLYDMNEEHLFELHSVFCRPSLPMSAADIPKQEDIDRWSYLSDVKIPHIDCAVGLLIGNDNPCLLEPHDIKNSQDGGPYAVQTILGWTINGPLGRHDLNRKHKANYVKGDPVLTEQFREFCMHEFNDSLASETTKMSQNDKEALHIMKDTTQLKDDNHYEMALPLKSATPCLPNNKLLAAHRLNLLKRRLQKDSDLYKKYVTFMNDLFSKEYAEDVLDQSDSSSCGKTWYLPHHPVISVKKPDKVRVVFDCSSVYRGVSLNDCLLSGPDLTSSLIGVLERFRQEPVAMISDIESMFYQVHVREEYRDMLRFLWWRDGNMNNGPETFRMRVHIFGATSSPSCCNYALRRIATDNQCDFDDMTMHAIERNFYVDDCLTSVADEDTAICLSKQLTDVLSRGGFHLTKWMSNSAKVMASIPTADRATILRDLDFSHSLMERALGVYWNVSSDTFCFKISIKERPPTRRGILSIMSSIYDPLGFVAPIVLPIKIMLQDLCKQGVDWDDPIPEDCMTRWKRWLYDLPKLEQFTIDRCVKPMKTDDIVSCELHHFSDASEVGYGAVVYMRCVDSSGNISCRFLMGKSRAAPLKVITIPRLELSASTLSVRLDARLRQELELSLTRSIFWTEKFIFNKDKRFHTFVANRIAMIHDGSETSAWRYIRSKMNPADDASRGLPVEKLIPRSRWSMGPGFLLQDEKDWPDEEENIDPISSDHPEVKKSCVVIVDQEHTNASSMAHIIDRFSSWYGLKKCVSWILRYKDRLQKSCELRRLGTPRIHVKNKDIEPITIEEMHQAETLILQSVQQHEYAMELRCLGAQNQANNHAAGLKRSSSLYKLDPVLKHGFLRIGGRIQNAPIEDDMKHQIILPKDHHVTKLLIRHYHEISGHSGRNYVLSLLRQKYWIVHGNSAVRRILADCTSCRRRQGSVGEQKMADLPQDRVEINHPPFMSVGVDFFGTFYVKRARRMVKRYGCIFTCLSTRAVHIEVTHSLDTSSFLNCIRRFMARRGHPAMIRSDNGGSFVSGEKELKCAVQEWNQEQIQDFFLQRSMKWYVSMIMQDVSMSMQDVSMSMQDVSMISLDKMAEMYIYFSSFTWYKSSLWPKYAKLYNR